MIIFISIPQLGINVIIIVCYSILTLILYLRKVSQSDSLPDFWAFFLNLFRMRLVLRRRESIHGLSFGLLVTVFSGMQLCVKDTYWFVEFFVAASILFVSVMVLSQSHMLTYYSKLWCNFIVFHVTHIIHEHVQLL